MELTKKQIKNLRESYSKHSYNQEYCWGFLESLKSLNVSPEQMKLITETKD